MGDIEIKVEAIKDVIIEITGITFIFFFDQIKFRFIFLEVINTMGSLNHSQHSSPRLVH